MAPQYLHKVNFTIGEIDPALQGRSDIDQYSAGLARAQNFLPVARTGLTKRSGSKFVAEIKDSSTPARLLPFIFNSSQSYVLEMGETYARIYAEGGRIEQSGVPVEVTTPWSESDLASLDYAQSVDVLYVSHGSTQPRLIARHAETDWQISEYENEDGPFLDENVTNTFLDVQGTGHLVPLMTSNTAPEGVVSSSTSSSTMYNLFNRSYDDEISMSVSSSSPWFSYQPVSAKTCVGYSIAASNTPGEAPQSWIFEGYDSSVSDWVLLDERVAEDAWQAREVRHYEIVNDEAFSTYRLTIKSSNQGSNVKLSYVSLWQKPEEQSLVTVIASSLVGINDDAGFKSSDVGRHIRLRGEDSHWRWMKIQSYVSPTEITVKIHGAALKTEYKTPRWRLGAWSETTGFPEKIEISEMDRLFFARTNAQPQNIWGSKVGNYKGHGTGNPLLADDALNLKILSSQINEVNWMADAISLIFGTDGRTHSLEVQDRGKALSATNVRRQKHESFGASDVIPITVGGALVYASKDSLTLRELVFSAERDGFIGPELTALSRHLFQAGIKEMAYAESPDKVIWTVTNDGALCSVTYDRDQKIIGAAQHVIGGVDVDVESVCVTPGTPYDTVWLLVKRTINGQTKRYVEVLHEPFVDQSLTESVFLDSSLNYEGAAVNTVSGFDHLEGETVSALADGHAVHDLIVTGGQVSLPEGITASKISIGLPFTARFETLKPSLQGRDGRLDGRRLRIVDAVIDLHRSLALKISAESAQDDLIHRKLDTALGDQDPLFTGRMRLPLHGGHGNEGVVSLVSDDPLPVTIRGLNIGFEVEP